MHKTELKDLSKEELQKVFKKTKSSYILILIAYALLLGVAVFTTFRKQRESGSMVFIFLPIIFMPVMMNVSKKCRAIRQEIKLREAYKS